MAEERRSKTRLALVLRLLAAAVVLALLVRIVDWRELTGLLASLRPKFVVLALLVLFAGTVVKTYRWYLVLQAGEPRVPLWMLVKCNLISYFATIVAPTSLTGEVIRVYYLTRRHADVKRVVSSILADRMIGGFSLGVTAAVAAVWIGLTGLFPVGTPGGVGIAAFFLLSILVPLALLSRRMTAPVHRLLGRLPDRWSARAKPMFESLVAYRDHGALLAASLAVSLAVVVLGLTEFYLVAQGLSSPAPFRYFLLFMPVAFFLSTVPVSVGGFGLPEAALVLFFTQVGLSLENCIAIVLVQKSLFLLSVLPGGYFFVVEGFPSKRIPPQPAALD